jgi:hypothetical protein
VLPGSIGSVINRDGCSYYGASGLAVCFEVIEHGAQGVRNPKSETRNPKQIQAHGYRLALHFP